MARSAAANFWYRMTRGVTGKSFSENGEARAVVAPEVGDRYAHATDARAVWVVETVLSVTASRYPLVRLTRDGYPDLTKVVSLAALTDCDEFLRMH